MIVISPSLDPVVTLVDLRSEVPTLVTAWKMFLLHTPKENVTVLSLASKSEGEL